MFKTIAVSFLLAASIFKPVSSFAWGKQGHQIVAQIASHYLSDSTKKKVKALLGNSSFEDAATWMDDSRSNDYYSFMRTWHYINLDKGQKYKPTSERNILTVLHAAITDFKTNIHLKQRRKREDLFMIFHLIGDLHQPLHVGYGSDKGGNDIAVSYIFKSYSTNLHSVWDTEIIESEKITADTCLKLAALLSKSDIENLKKINEVQWFNESRSFLDKAYKFDNGFLDKNYVLNNKSIVEKQLLVAGIRLAAVLESLYKK